MTSIAGAKIPIPVKIGLSFNTKCWDLMFWINMVNASYERKKKNQLRFMLIKRMIRFKIILETFFFSWNWKLLCELVISFFRHDCQILTYQSCVDPGSINSKSKKSKLQVQFPILVTIHCWPQYSSNTSTGLRED